MREVGGENYFKSIFRSFDTRQDHHIHNYGSDNHLRLTGKHETQSIHKFSWGVSDRGASIRVPRSVAELWKGYVEDRRPASNANPYEIIKVISDTIDMADELSVTLNNMYSNVNTKNFDDLKSKYNGIPTAKELLDEYKNDDDYELSEEMTESRANIKPESINKN